MPLEERSASLVVLVYPRLLLMQENSDAALEDSSAREPMSSLFLFLFLFLFAFAFAFAFARRSCVSFLGWFLYLYLSLNFLFLFLKMFLSLTMVKDRWIDDWLVGWMDGWLADTVRYATVFYCITGDCNGCY